MLKHAIVLFVRNTNGIEGLNCNLDIRTPETRTSPQTFVLVTRRFYFHRKRNEWNSGKQNSDGGKTKSVNIHLQYIILQVFKTRLIIDYFLG